MLVAIACESDPVSRTNIDQPGLPRLQRVEIPKLDSVGPERSWATYAVSSNGRLAFTTGFDLGNRVIAVVDSSGTLLHRVAPQGSGPGELEGDRFIYMAFAGDTLVVHDMIKRRILTFSPESVLLRTSVSFDGGMPVRIGVDSSDFVIIDFAGIGSAGRMPRPTEIRRVSSGSGEGRLLLDLADPMYDSLRTEAAWALSLSSPVTSTGDIVVVADPIDYRFQSFDRLGKPINRWGRDIPRLFRSDATVDSMLKVYRERVMPARLGGSSRPVSPRELANYENSVRQPLPHFFHVAFDDHGRFWTFGREESGEAFGDVFLGNLYLGRVSGPCNMRGMNAPSLRGDFFAVLCADPSRDAGVELRLYRMTY
jgi:hypothetical protein